MRFLILGLSFIFFSSNSFADTNFSDKIKLAMESSIRTEADIKRDANRKPVETLEFFGIKSDMKVLELIPGSGWYTKLLAPALKQEGQLYVAIGTGRFKENLAVKKAFNKVTILEPSVAISKSSTPGVRTASEFLFSEDGFDAALTFRNMHNFDAAGRKNINQAVYDALKPGGIYGVVDHTKRHMEPFSAENRRRADPVDIIKELLEVGFEFVDFSNLHYRPDDELRYEVGRKSVTGNTDRFTLLFKKPVK